MDQLSFTFRFFDELHMNEPFTGTLLAPRNQPTQRVERD